MAVDTRTHIILLLITILASAACSSPEKFPNPTSANSRFPVLSVDRSGTLFLSWIGSNASSDDHSLLYARYDGDSWSRTEPIATGSDWFVNWADYPSVISNEGTPHIAHWLKKIPGNTYSYNVQLSTYGKSDHNWSAPLTPHKDGTATEHGFVSMVPWEGNNTLAIWLDGRRTESRSEEEYGDITKAMTLRSAIIDMEGRVVKKFLLDETVCDCCNTSLSLTGKGAIAAYRDRTEEEVRDIYVQSFNGKDWGNPVRVHEDNWQISACPVNGPRIVANESHVFVAWYTRANGQPAVKAAVSTNGGSSFSEPVIVSNNKPMGRVDAVIDGAGNAYVSWIENNGGRGRLMVRSLSSNLEMKKPVSVSEIGISRESGFPQLAYYDHSLVFAWTVSKNLPEPEIEIKALPLAAMF